jgi:hypothetical protein
MYLSVARQSVEPRPQRAKAWCEARKLFEMTLTELAQPARAGCGEPQPNDTLIVGIGTPRDESGRHRAVHETDRAVMAQQQRLGDVTDRGIVRTRVTTDREQQLMLRRRQVDFGRLFFAPAQEAADTGAPFEEPLIVGVGELGGVGRAFRHLAPG